MKNLFEILSSLFSHRIRISFVLYGSQTNGFSGWLLLPAEHEEEDEDEEDVDAVPTATL